MIHYGFACVLTVLVHEYGHVVPAKIVGWKLLGWRFQKGTFGYAFDMQEKGRMRIVAAGGLFASFGLAMIALATGNFDLLVLNVLFVLVNVIPIPRLSDGWYVWKGI